MKNILIALMLITTPAAAQGSMAPEVRVIVVPNPARRVQNLYKKVEKDRTATTKQRVKDMEVRQKNYQKQMDDWAKELKKKKK